MGPGTERWKRKRLDVFHPGNEAGSKLLHLLMHTVRNSVRWNQHKQCYYRRGACTRCILRLEFTFKLWQSYHQINGGNVKKGYKGTGAEVLQKGSSWGYGHWKRQDSAVLASVHTGVWKAPHVIHTLYGSNRIRTKMVQVAFFPTPESHRKGVHTHAMGFWQSHCVLPCVLGCR